MNTIGCSKVLHISTSDGEGGAGRAALRLHQSLHYAGWESEMRVAVKLSKDPRVHGAHARLASARNLLRRRFGSAVARLIQTANPALHSCSWLPSSLDRELNRSDASILHLHWVCGELLSIEAIGRLRSPVVWTLHDSWAFSGAEHYQFVADDQRYQYGYTHVNRPEWEHGCDINRWVWQRKKRAWRNPMNIVAPSQWLASRARSSMLMHEWPVYCIPNPLDTEFFKPLDKGFARDVLGLPRDCALVLFGAMSAAEPLIKGIDLLWDSLRKLAKNCHRPIAGVVLGQSEPISPPDVGMPLYWLGSVKDDRLLPLVYSAADVAAVPSRVDNFPQMGTEAQACGCPVVAFSVGGLGDVVEDGISGRLVEAFDTSAFAMALKELLENRSLAISQGSAARTRAVGLWSYPTVARRYAELYAAISGLSASA